MQVLRLANETQTTVIDLIGGPLRLRSGLDFATPGQGGVFTFEPYGAQWEFGNFQPQTETFDLGMRASGTVVIAEMNRLQDFLEAVRLFHAGDLAAESCWLEWSAHGEEVKRSLLYSATFKATSQDNITPGLEDCTVLGTLSLTRHPLWEESDRNITRIPPTRATSPVVATTTTIGGAQAYTDWPGNTLGRIWETEVGAPLGQTTPLVRGWVGIRRFNQGTANFNTVWEVEDGTAGTDCGAAVLDATASPEHLGAGTGARRRVTYVNLTLQPRWSISIAQVAAAYGHADYNHFQGRYLVLLRCKVTAGTSGIQMRYGYTDNQSAEEVYIDNTNWRFIPLGNISIPPWEGYDYRAIMFYGSYTISIYAEQLAAGNLDLDCLVLIPNEHMLTFEGADIYNSAAGPAIPAYLVAMVNADDTDMAYNFDTNLSALSDTVEYTMNDWYLPPGDGIIVVAAEQAAVSDVMDEIYMATSSIPRWTLYRGS